MGKAIVKGSDIEGVIIQPLKQIRDERGSVMHMLRSDSQYFEQFGEIYFSTIKQGVIKAWKWHKVMTQNLAVPMGQIKLVIFDDRQESNTRGNLLEIKMGLDKYSLVKIPPELWYGFQGIAKNSSLIVNCTTIPHDDNEVIILDYRNSDIPYKW